MHVLPRVGQLHERFADSLEVIAVHAGKFVTERVTARIADACARLGVHHPVVNDRQFRTWREYGVQAWPTVAVIDPEGYLVGIQSGEFQLEPMAAAIQKVAERADSRGTLSRRPGLSVHVEPHVTPGALRFPTRAVITGGKLWVSDTGAGRVLECAWDGALSAARVLRAYDGFVEPRGIAELGGALYVADRRGQAVWRLAEGDRERVAGTGVLADYAVDEGRSDTDVRSPWGIAALGDKLAIAMAGSHQLWTLDPASGDLDLLAGRGGENIADGPARKSLLAQPTGAALSGAALAFADCETSAARILESGTVRTIVGTDLFEFGDKPGVADDARQQHCEDIAWHRGVLALADTYNDRLKLVDPVSRECVPWPGEAGESGSLREPGGVFSDGETLLVADTGNHRVVRVSDDGSLVEVVFS